MTTRDAVVLYQYTTETSVAAVSTGAPWPAGKLVVSPGNYFFDNNIAFDFTREGFYAVWATDGVSYDAGNLIVFKTDVMLLMASLARVTGCGNADEALTIAQQIDMGRARAIWLRCGPTINLVKYWCGQFAIPCREVHFLTGNMPSTPGIDLTLDPHSGDVVDTGHVLIEVQVNGKWVLADVATDAAYKDAAGNWLSMGAVIAAGVANCTTVNLADPDYEQDNYSGAFSSGAYANLTLRPENIGRWRKGIYQIPGILGADGNIYFYLPAGVTNTAAWVASLAPNYRVMSQASWLAKYYPNGV